MMKRLLPILALAALVPSTRAAITPKTERTEAKTFARVDKDGDEKISYEEFKALLTPLKAALRKFPVTGRGDDPAELLELCDAVFALFDKNVSGFVEFNEWLAVRRSPAVGPLADVLKSVPGLDRNGNGQVSILEFLPLVKCFVPAATAKDAYYSILAAHASSGSSSGGLVIVGLGEALPPSAASTGGRGSGGPQTGTPSDTGIGTTAGISAGSAVSTSSSVAAAWARQDPSAAAAWVQQLPDDSSDRLPPEFWERFFGNGDGTSEGTVPVEELNRGRRTGVPAE